MKTVLMTTATMLGAGLATAQPAATSAPQPVDSKPKLICHKVDTLGSRLGGHRECHTDAEWRAINRDEADTLNRRTQGTQKALGG